MTIKTGAKTNRIGHLNSPSWNPWDKWSQPNVGFRSSSILKYWSLTLIVTTFDSNKCFQLNLCTGKNDEPLNGDIIFLFPIVIWRRYQNFQGLEDEEHIEFKAFYRDNWWRKSLLFFHYKIPKYQFLKITY